MFTASVSANEKEATEDCQDPLLMSAYDPKVR